MLEVGNSSKHLQRIHSADSLLLCDAGSPQSASRPAQQALLGGAKAAPMNRGSDILVLAKTNGDDAPPTYIGRRQNAS